MRTTRGSSALALGEQLYSERYCERLAEAMGVDPPARCSMPGSGATTSRRSLFRIGDDQTKIVLQPNSRQASTSRNTVTVHFHRG
jgi:hypothetical protein